MEELLSEDDEQYLIDAINGDPVDAVPPTALLEMTAFAEGPEDVFEFTPVGEMLARYVRELRA